MSTVSRAAFAQSATTADPATSLVISKPSSSALVAGDLLVACITSNDTAHGVPSGWVTFGGDSLVGSTPSVAWQVRLYYRIVTGSEGSSFTWTVGGGGPSAGLICAYRGVDTTNPIDSITQNMPNGTVGEPRTGPSATAISPVGRTVYVRSVRRSSAGGSPCVLSSAASGVTRELVSGANGLSTSGNTNYTITAYSENANYSTAGSKSGLAISCSPDETQNYETTFNLRAMTDGSAAVSVPLVEVDVAGHHRIDAVLDVATLLPTVVADGIAQPPSGPLSMTLPLITADLAGQIIHGSMSVDLHLVTANLTATHVGGSFQIPLPLLTVEVGGGVVSFGPFQAFTPMVVVDFVAETKPFGEHVIVVARDERAFMVTDDDTGLIPMKRSKVTQL